MSWPHHWLGWPDIDHRGSADLATLLCPSVETEPVVVRLLFADSRGHYFTAFLSLSFIRGDILRGHFSGLSRIIGLQDISLGVHKHRLIVEVGDVDRHIDVIDRGDV